MSVNFEVLKQKDIQTCVCEPTKRMITPDGKRLKITSSTQIQMTALCKLFVIGVAQSGIRMRSKWDQFEYILCHFKVLLFGTFLGRDQYIVTESQLSNNLRTIFAKRGLC